MARELIVLALAAALAACNRGDAGKPAGSGRAPLAGKPFYRIDPGTAAPCASGGTCQAQLVLTALRDYHVNKDYPFKFVAEPAPAPPVDGEGVFELDDAQHGTLTVTFRPPAAGTARLVGTFKLSVCNDDTCEIEAPKIELAVPVS